MFGFKDKPKSPSNTAIVKRDQEALNDLLKMVPNKKAQKILKEWVNSENKDTDYGDYRKILKQFFPGSGLLQMTNKNTGEVRQIATYTGPADEQGLKQFNDYRIFSHILAKAKGIKPVDSITVSSELGKALKVNKTLDNI
tara:strand:+ start:55 stop:474 length:420 start_codon:yes stop_codon:yes gene_type:complete